MATAVSLSIFDAATVNAHLRRHDGKPGGAIHREDDLRKWARLTEPTEWRLWR